MLGPFDIKVHFEMEPWCDMRDEKKEKKDKIYWCTREQMCLLRTKIHTLIFEPKVYFF